MPYEYSENELVQESAGNLLEQVLGWEVKLAYNTEQLGSNGTFGRASYKEILLTRYFRAALQKLNPWITEAQLTEALQTLQRRLSTYDDMQVNEEKYFLIRDGIPVTVQKPNGQTEERKALVIDFQNPENNHFLAIKELKIDGDIYHRRTDIVGFVNGLPLLFMEFKRNDVDVEDSYTNNYTDYRATIPHLFQYNAFLVLSNGMQAKVGTLDSKYEFFHEWKRLEEKEQGSVALETMLRGICNKKTFLDLFENFILYDHSGGKTVKILSRNHQYLGVNEAVQAYADRKLNKGRLGVFWHTQGSGKSYSMAFLAQKIRRKFEGSPTIVVLTDREELNRQISDTFENCGLLGKSGASKSIATSANDLVSKLQGNPGFIFTLIQKFNNPNVPPITPNHDIIIMSDEAHRSQYGAFAENMMTLLPTASRIGFTGTPLLSNDNITERTFGGYVSVYDFKRAVEDGATVPLYYENRGEKILDLQNPEITDRILAAIEAADLDPSQQEKLEHEFKHEIHLLTAESRLRAIARDFVTHYSDLWTTGKAMFVCLNKVTCVRMFNFVQQYWQEEISRLEQELAHISEQQTAQELARKLDWMRQTEMCVVVSQDQNEMQTFQKWGLDIVFHRTKMEKRELDKEFKDKDSPFRVVFVCAMWLTGFDVKTLSCLYLDKPLKAHTLMQTIARANRVAEGKSNGLVIDYIGIVKALRKALADYTANPSGNNGGDPTIDKPKLLERFGEVLQAAEEFLAKHDFRLMDLVEATHFAKLALIKTAANAMCASLEIKKTFQTYTNELVRLGKYLGRDDLSDDTRAKKDALLAIDRELRDKRKHADNTDLMVEINRIISDYVEMEEQAEGVQPSRRFDISQIDFDILHREFAKSKKRNLLMRDLAEMIEQKLQSMIALNPSRVNYQEAYQKIIEEYNGEQDASTIEKIFKDLMDLANTLSEEEQRYVREGFTSDEELALFDKLVTKDLTKQDIKALKLIAADLLAKIKALIATLDHWTDKPSTIAEVQNLIRDTLYQSLPDSMFTESNLAFYREKVFDYIYAYYKAA